jgi:hypothetical protein
MGLALPLGLLGLLLVGIPLYLHRVRRRSLRDIALPTIGLLSRAVVQKRRTLSFLDRPLLYARVALAILCALALSRPYLSLLASYATERPIALSIVIDDSMSMQRRAARGGSLFEVAATRAQRVLAELAPESEASIVLAGNVPRVFSARSKDVASLRDKVSTLTRVGARGTALKESVALALRELATSQLALKEVLVLTDCAAHADADMLELPGAHVRVECMAARNAQPNAYITDMTLRPGAEVNAPATLTLTLKSQDPLNELELSVHADGRRVAEPMALLNEGAGTIEVPLEPAALRDARVLSARIESENAIGEDDVRDLLLDDRGELSLLLVDGDPAPNQLDDELRYAAIALSVTSGEQSLPRVTRIDADGLPAADLASHDVIVLANVRAPGAELAARIERYVARGGGLLIAAGDHVDAFAYRGSMGELLPAVVRSSAPADPPLAVDARSAAESRLLPDQARGLETGSTHKRLLLEPPVAPSQTLLAFQDGTPLLVAGTHGQGSVALLTTTLDDDWSDLPLTPGYLPLLTGLTRGLAAVDALPPGPHRAGSVLATRVPVGATALYLLTPDGRRVDLEIGANDVAQAKARADHVIAIRDTALSGAYRVFAELDDRREQELEQLSFVVVPDIRDSDLGLRLPRPQDAARRQKTSAARARGIEGWFWLLFGLLAIAEGALRVVEARASAREPSRAGGSAPGGSQPSPV